MNASRERKFETLHLEFDPDLSPDGLGKTIDCTWPWSYFEKAKDLAASYGVQMTWNRPGISQEEWNAAWVPRRATLKQINGGRGLQTEMEIMAYYRRLELGNKPETISWFRDILT